MNDKVKQATQTVRFLKIAFVVAQFLFLYIVVRIPAHAIQSPAPSFQTIIAGIALVCLVAGFNAQKLLAQTAGRTVSAQPSKSPVQAWISGCLLSLALFEACGLFGIVLHFTGAGLQLTAGLSALGILSTILWQPASPPKDGTDSNASAGTL